ncbi:MAG TPA: cyclophane-forming radical SAM/SPASM peptide maturase GrrM/OscB [Gemmataceae bacterium]|nr:cyclophane-forming radical SAM/SPASM peptide maturase GrrM/OscB [Gemmataceae bacterium]
MASPSDLPGPLELLVLQPTPFCNINCSYCYLPDRQSTRRMSPATLERTFEWVFSSGLVREPFTLLWHAGEPLVMPLPFYEDAVVLLERHNRPGVTVYQSFQTNATLLDDAWCDFIRRHGIHLGVSVDGPAHLHDSSRRTRQGKGTLDRVLHGIHLLHEHQVPFYVISVLTADSLNYADELFDFYQEHRISQVCFNVEEIEGPNTSSSLLGAGMKERFRRFFSRFMDLACSAEPPLMVREFETSAGALLGVRYGPGARTQENKPWAIVNVDCDGNFSTYSPELLGLSSPRYGSFALGNVAADSLGDVIASERFRALEADVSLGGDLCRQSCPYFAFCGGGPPANKYFENGTFASTETLFCRLHKQVCLDVTLERLERQQKAVLSEACPT